MPSVKIINGKGLLGSLHGRHKNRISCEAMVPKDGVVTHPEIEKNSSFSHTSSSDSTASIDMTNSERSTMSEVKRSQILEGMPRFFYEVEAHHDPPYVSCKTLIQKDGVVTHPEIDNNSTNTSSSDGTASIDMTNSERSTMSEVKRSQILEGMPRFFYEAEAHDDSPYVSIFTDH
ncbi:unnamed protein product [Cylindrotheca closterium]|uniref:Uncharacterized protein n=1 Tax=Cylindrotheca closterium TaxID=2856 RepID=A0AAD2FR82_9STRA|nr:unnamed protein product [Cylindrotheca closterium]